jgi:hypothetical protein
MRRLKRALVSEAIYQGTFPEELYLSNVDEAPRRRSRCDADAVAAKILRVSPRAISAARKACLHEGAIYPLGIARRGKRLDLDAWEELIGMMRLAIRK